MNKFSKFSFAKLFFAGLLSFSILFSVSTRVSAQDVTEKDMFREDIPDSLKKDDCSGSMVNGVCLPGGLTNPAIPEKLGNNYSQARSGSLFAYYFVYMWRVVVTIGGLLVIINFVWGAFDWISAAGEKGKLDSARNKITGSVIGLAILVGSFAIIQFIGGVLQIDLLNPKLTTANDAGAILKNVGN